MRFAYYPYPVGPLPHDPRTEVWRPALKVVVAGPKRDAQELRLWGVLDTAADVCVLPLVLAEVLKPNWKGGPQKLTGFGGEEHLTRYGEVSFRIRLEKVTAKWKAVVAFKAGREDSLWGMTGFLERFRVSFDGPGNHFTILLRTIPQAGLLISPAPRRRGRKRGQHLPILPDDQDP